MPVSANVIAEYFSSADSSILTSTDKIKWTDVGCLPSNYGNLITTVKLKRSNCKYFKMNHTSYLGVGYLKLIKST